MVTFLFLIAGFGLLIKGAGFLVDGASSIARKLKVSDLAIGLTAVAFGTSTPELFVNIIASSKGASDIAIGNILGSNIANILLILGICAVVFPLTVTKSTVWKEIPLSLLAAILVGILGNDYFIDAGQFSGLTRIDGLILLSFFIIFIYYTAGMARDILDLSGFKPSKQYTLAKSILFFSGGLVALIIGSKWIVDSAIEIASSLGFSESFIGLTIVAVGTSLPELATSLAAAFKKNPEIAIGNIVGSNIFNIFLILGVSSVIRPLPFQLKINFDIGTTIIASLLLFICMFTGKRHRIDRWEGFTFVFIYIVYIAFLIYRK